MSDSTEEFIEGFLMHRSKYYDPEKAHEYYMRKRKLKGRELAKKGESLAPTRLERATNIANRASRKVGSKQAEHIQALSEQTRNKLHGMTKELEAWVHKISQESEAQHQKIATETQAKLDRLPALPKRATPEMKAARDAKIAKIRGEGRQKQASLNESTKAKYEAKKVEVRTEKDKVLADYKEAVNRIVSRSERN